MKIFISAAEASSDTHAAEVLKRLRSMHASVSPNEPFEAFGVGGPKLRAAGLEPLVPAEDLLAMGFVEVLSRLPRIKRNLELLELTARKRQPDVAVLCDYPEFHFKLARRLKKLGIPVVCYIPPKVWVWRKKRLEQLASLYTRVLSILPFEAKTYEGSGVSFEYVGNPLMDELPLMLTREEARRQLGLDEEEGVLLLMVGSRPSELKYHLEPLLEAASLVVTARGSRKTRILIPLPETADRARFEARILESPFAKGLDLRVSSGDAWVAMKAADAGIVKSGTSSLEAAVLDCPHVVVYRAHPISEWIYRNIIRYRGAISLTNLILSEGVSEKERVVPELILEAFRPDHMAQEALRVFSSSPARSEMLGAFARLRNRLRGQSLGDSPSERAAEAIHKIARDRILGAK